MEALAILELFKNSNAWDARYDLPAVPQHANPIIYTAYAKKIIGTLPILNEHHFEALVLEMLDSHNMQDLSHDEKLGAAYLSLSAANAILFWEIKVGSADERFLFYGPFIRASAGYRVGYYSQAMWALHFVWSAITQKNDGTKMSGVLKNWLMLDAAEKFPISALGAWFWKMWMRKLKISPRKAFETYLVECPVFHDTAPETF